MFKAIVRNILYLSGFLVMVLLGSSCGIYSLSPGGKSSIKTIAVRQFENNTIEYALSSRLTDLVVDAIIADGNLKIVSENDADAILTGVLTNYVRNPYTYDESDNVSQYVVKLTFDITLLKNTDEVIWEDTFYSEGVYEAADETDEDGQIRAAQKLVVDIINKTTKSW